jgi:hypothetical protein
MSLRSIANLSFGRRGLVFAIRRKNYGLAGTWRGHADKLQASRESDSDTGCREYKICHLRRRRSKTDLPSFDACKRSRLPHPPKMVVTDSYTTYYTFNRIVFRVCNFEFR